MRRPCINCGLSPKEPHTLICPSCLQDIKPINWENRCSICANPLNTDYACSDCRDRVVFWNKCETFYPYNDFIIRELFLSYKFEASLAAEEELVFLLAPKLEKLKGEEIIIIPCGQDTILRLGFNPTARLLESCGIKTVSPFIKTDGQAQKVLSASERRLRKNFLALKPNFIPKKNITIADDVLTTGSTLNEAARLLKEKGVSNIKVLSFLRD